MKKALPAALAILILFLSSCGSPIVEVTPTPEPTPTEEVTPTPIPTEAPVPGALTEEELRWFEEEFFRSHITNIRTVFGRPWDENIYEKPQDINLARLFSYSDLDKASDDEVSELISRGAFGGAVEYRDGYGYSCPVYRITREEMSQVLLKYTGLTLEETNQVGLEHSSYLEEYDAYYWCLGDGGPLGPLTILKGVRVGSTVNLYQYGLYNESDLLYCLTLEQQPEGNYWFVSNLPVAGE